ncbi:MAG: response regulator, partial [Candidatus Binataceae bacterium]
MTMQAAAERIAVVGRVLVVEDEEDIRDLVRFNLEREGFAVDEAGDGSGALETIGRQIPQALLLDLMLPGMSGLELCRRLRADARTSHLAIVML